MRKQLDELTEQNRALQTENCSLQALVTAGGIREQAMLAMHEKATEIFARQVGRKRSRSSTPPPPSASNVASEAERQAGIDRYVEGVLELRDATHARAVEELKKAHKAETDKLRAKAREPVNEFRESKRFHIREAELKAEVEKAKRALEAEKERAKSMEFEQVDRMDDKRQIRDLRHRCADRDLLAQEVERLKEEKERRNEPYRDMTNAELLGMIDVLKVCLEFGVGSF